MTGCDSAGQNLFMPKCLLQLNPRSGSMWRYIIIAVSLLGTATILPALVQEKLVGPEAGQDYFQQSAGPIKSQRLNDSNPLAGRFAKIDADKRGHFIASAKLNGRGVDVLVDTGATLVALNESTARRIGIRLKPDDFKYVVRTANGEAMAAAATIDEIRIGRITVRDIPATVAKDSALSSTLLGMSFLNRLKKFEVDSGTLILTQ
jgi:aspartyl protease family protein